LFGGEPQQVCGDAHLAVAAVTCPDADHRDGQRLLHPARQLGRNMFQHQGEAALLLEGARLINQAFLADGVRGLAPVPQAMHGLRGEAQMPHHGNAHAYKTVDYGDNLGFRPLQFHRRCAGLLQQTPCSRHGAVFAALVAEKGQVTDQQGLVGRHGRQSPGHRLGVMKHLVQAHRECCGMAQRHHRQ